MTLMPWLIDDCDEREEHVIVLWHAEHLSPAEIGQVLGVDESEVLRIHADVVRRVKQRLGVDRAA